MIKNVKQGVTSRLSAYRNPVYLLYSIGGVSLVIFSGLIAQGGIGPLEASLFGVFNNLGDAWFNTMLFITIIGTVIAFPVVVIIALFRRHYANALKVFIGGIAASRLAYLLEGLNIRQVPQDFINTISVKHNLPIMEGFPNSFMAMAAVLALTSYMYLPKKFHKIITGLVILVAISQMYLGLALPLDLLGGWGIGLTISGLLNFAFGSRRYSPVPPAVVKHKLDIMNLGVESVDFASVDARGSVPYIAKGKNKNYFVKIVGLENNIADWLFKLFRRIIYSRLEDEQPFLSPKRQLEHEAYVAMLAKQAGITTPTITAVFEPEPGRWAMAQEMINGKSLDKIDPTTITDKILLEIWQQVDKLHKNNIIHRDLRTANIFLDTKGRPWLIDFGFSEASVKPESFYRDNIELIASMSLLVGPQRAVDSALKTIGKDQLLSSLPYLSYSALSGATTKAVKSQKGLFKQIRQELIGASGAKQVKNIKLKRFNFKTFLVLISIGIAYHVLAPQLVNFNEAFKVAETANIAYIAVAVIFSVLTYFLSGLAYKFIAIYPLKVWPTVLIQFASSFASKLAPAGTGGMALNGRYLYKNNHDIPQSAAIAFVNTILGLAGHVSLVIIVSLLTRESILNLIPDFHIPSFVILIMILAAITVVVSFAVFPKARKYFAKSKDKIIKDIKHYKKNPDKLFRGYLASIGITLAYSITLYYCALALGVALSPLDVVYVFTLGSIVATVTPTPGGIGGAEAAYVASLTSLGLDASVALAITMLYRLLTFWLPIIPGFLSFRYVSKKDYI